MTKVAELHQKWMKDARYRQAHEELQPEFDSARAALGARAAVALSHPCGEPGDDKATRDTLK